MKVWDNQCEELIQKYNKKGNKYRPLVYRLGVIDPMIRYNTIANYYRFQKIRYLSIVRAWAKQRIAQLKQRPKGIKKGNPTITIKKKISNINIRSVEKRKPLFEYMPTKDLLEKMILRVVET